MDLHQFTLHNMEIEYEQREKKISSKYGDIPEKVLPECFTVPNHFLGHFERSFFLCVVILSPSFVNVVVENKCAVLILSVFGFSVHLEQADCLQFFFKP